MKNTIQQIINAFLLKNHLFGTPLVVAVSGGSDSMCLLHALCSLKQNIIVAHLNHMIRNTESKEDAIYVKQFCTEHQIKYITEDINVPLYQTENHISSTEEAARIVRYDFLCRTALKYQGVVLTGHNKEDNTETILMHIIRGCGPSGLVGLSEISNLQTTSGIVKIARPLLTVSKNETLKYCEKNKIIPRFDSTNNSMEYTRNRIRKELIPQLTSYNTEIQNALLRLATLTKELSDYADSTLDQLPYFLDIRETSVSINRNDFIKLHPYAQKALLRLAIKAMLGHTLDIENKHIEDMLQLTKGPSGKQISLPNQLIWHTEYLRFTLSFLNENTETIDDFDIDLNIPGITIVGDKSIKAELIDYYNTEVKYDPDCAFFDYDLLGELHIRNKHTGDTFIPFGTQYPKKIARFLLDMHVPINERDNSILICNNEEIIWLVGLRQSDLYKITDHTHTVLKLTINKT